MSTHVSSTAATTYLPPLIEERLTYVVDRHQSNERVYRYGGWFTMSVIAILLMVSVDLVFEFDTATSRLFGWVVAIVSFVLVARLWQRSIQRPLNLVEAACKVEAVRPDMEERLTSTVELMGHSKRTPTMPTPSAMSIPAAIVDCSYNGYSPQLIAALGREATDQIASVDCDDVPVRASWPLHVAVGCSLTIFLCLAMANPEAVACSLRNWMMPWATPIFPLLQADIQPGDTTIVEGENLDFRTQSFGRGKRPLFEYWTDDASGTNDETVSIKTQELVETASAGSGVLTNDPQLATTLTALSADTNYRLRLGKRVSQTYHVRVLPQPKILAVNAQVAFPAYTNLPAETHNDTSGAIPVLSGSEVAIRVTGDQHAQLAELRWLDDEDKTEVSSNLSFILSCIEAKQMVGEIRLKSADGIYSTVLPIKIDVHQDQPPQIKLLDPTLARFPMARDRELAVRYDASDDLHVEQVEIFYQATDAPDNLPPNRITAPMEASSDNDRFKVQGTVFVDFDRLPEQCKGAVVWLRASDNRANPFGGPQTAESPRMIVDFQPTDATPLEQRLAAEQQQIEQALQEARQELEMARDQTQQLANNLQDVDLQDADPNGNDGRISNELKGAQSQIRSSRQAADRLAEKLDQANSNFAEHAQATKQMNDDHINAAQQQLDRAALTGNPQDKLQPATQAKAQLKQAIDDLKELEDQLQEKMAALQTAAKLEDLARQQQKLTEEVKPDGNPDAAKSDQDAAADSKPSPPPNDWKQRQEQVADELAAMVDDGHDNDSGDDKLENRRREQQAAAAERLAEQAERLAENWDQANKQQKDKTAGKDEQKTPDAEAEAEKLAQQIGKLQDDAAKLAGQPLPNEEARNQLKDAQASLKRSTDQAAQQARASEQPGKQSEATDRTPSDLLRQASDALKSVCKSCRQGANGRQPASGQELAEAQQQCDAAAQAPTAQNAKQHAQQAAEKLSKLAEQAAKQTGLRKNCDKCKNPRDGQTGQSVESQKPGDQPSGTRGIVEQPFEQRSLRGESSSGWTRAKRQLRNGVLDGREAMIPEAFRDVVTDYFQALAKDGNLDEDQSSDPNPPFFDSKPDDANGVGSEQGMQ